jgi:hypothetical protein
MFLHTDRYYPTQTLIKHGVVIHDAESGDGASDALVNFLTRPGSNPSTRGGFWGPGYHAVTDGRGGYIMVADATAGPYSAPPLNPTWWHICMPGYANQTREMWQDSLSKAHMRGLAKFLVDKWNEDRKTWPLSFVDAFDLLNGKHGYTSHAQVSLAWHETDHTDPGVSFPWDILQSMVHDLIQSPPEDDFMYLANLTGDRVAVVGSSVRPVSEDEVGPEGPYVSLPHFTPDPDSTWHAWVSAAYEEYARRMGM